MSSKMILLIVGVLLFTGLSALGCYYLLRQPANELHLYGVVEMQEVRLGSKIGGRVGEIYVQEGDTVNAGDLLVWFEMPEMEAQRAQQVSRFHSTLAELEKAWYGPRKEEIEMAESDVKAAKADRVLAAQEHARIDRLYNEKALNRSDLDNARANLDRAIGRLESTEAKLKLLRAGTRIEDIAEIQGRLSEIMGKIEEIDANLREALVVAPDRAFIQILSVRKGDLIQPNQPVVRILRPDDLWVRIYVPETDLAKVKIGQTVSVAVDSYPGKRFKGTVIQISSESEFTPRNIQSVDERRHQVFGVKVSVDNSKQTFKSGMAAEVWIETNEGEK